VQIDVLSTTFPNWTRLETPNLQVPCWHEEDGTPHPVGDATAGASPALAAKLERLHWEAIGTLAQHAFTARHAGDNIEARRLSHAASLLCGEITGLVTSSTRGC
jgi:hypothetical protein